MEYFTSPTVTSHLSGCETTHYTLPVQTLEPYEYLFALIFHWDCFENELKKANTLGWAWDGKVIRPTFDDPKRYHVYQDRDASGNLTVDGRPVPNDMFMVSGTARKDIPGYSLVETDVPEWELGFKLWIKNGVL